MQLFLRDDVRGMIDALAAERHVSPSDLIAALVREERARNPPPKEEARDVPPSPLASFATRVLAFLDRDGDLAGPVLAWRMSERLERVYAALAKHAGAGNVVMKRNKRGDVVFALTPEGKEMLYLRRR
jgi:hypothetical protein